MALLAEEDNECSGCGQPRDESMRPGNDDAYEATVYSCFGCAEIERERAHLNEGSADHGLRIGIRKRS